MSSLFGRIALVSAVITIIAGAPLLAQPPAHNNGGYVQEEVLGYTSPKPPELPSPEGQADIKAVRAAQADGEARRREAFEDAGAYSYDQLIVRFSEAAGTSLDLHSHPILGHMLKRLLIDSGNFVNDEKFSNPRQRPYREDRTIIPCETDYLYPTDNQSYPSGHAANGYVAARLIAEVITADGEPDRRSVIGARGQRYGENRVVCGVHHPSDIREGRLVAEHVWNKAFDAEEFKADLACAKEEQVRSTGGRLISTPAPFSPACQAMSDHDLLESLQRSG